MGVYDQGNSALITGLRSVGFWSATGSAGTIANSGFLFSGSLDPNIGTQVGQFFFTPITPQVLTAGTYVIGADNIHGDPFLFATTTQSPGPGITIIQDQSNGVATSGLTFPGATASSTNPIFYAYADFQFTAVPEIDGTTCAVPITLAMGALLLLGDCRRRKGNLSTKTS